METYIYTARDRGTNQRVSAQVQKENEREVYALLEDLHLIPVEVRRTETRPAGWKVRFRKEKIILFNEMATYKRNNVAAAEMANDLLQIFDADSKWYPILKGFLADVTGNRKLHQAMSERPDIFSPHEVELMKTAHEIGKEVEMLQTLAKYLRRTDRVMNKVVLTMVYPIILVAGIIVSSVIYAVVMLPQLMRLYTSLNITPTFPLPQLFWLMSVEETLPGMTVSLVALGALVGGFAFALKSPKTAIYIDRFVLNFPLFGELLTLQRLSRTLFVLDLMLTAGQKARAFEAALASATGAVFTEALARCQAEIGAGNVKKWNDAFALAPEIFSVTLIGLMRSGERNGKVSDKLRDAILLTEERIDEIILVLPERLQTALTIVFTVVVGFLMYAMVVPTSQAIAALR